MTAVPMNLEQTLDTYTGPSLNLIPKNSSTVWSRQPSPNFVYAAATGELIEENKTGLFQTVAALSAPVIAASLGMPLSGTEIASLGLNGALWTGSTYLATKTKRLRYKLPLMGVSLYSGAKTLTGWGNAASLPYLTAIGNGVGVVANSVTNAGIWLYNTATGMAGFPALQYSTFQAVPYLGALATVPNPLAALAIAGLTAYVGYKFIKAACQTIGRLMFHGRKALRDYEDEGNRNSPEYKQNAPLGRFSLGLSYTPTKPIFEPVAA